MSPTADRVGIQLRAPRLVAGTVRAPDAANAPMLVAATLEFRRRDSLPGENTVTRRSSTMLSEGGTIRPSTFSVALLPGTYDITVTPDDRELPRYFTSEVVTADADNTVFQLDIAYSSLTHVDGRVIDDLTGAPIVGAAVSVVDPGKNGLVISTTALSGAEGEFDVRLSPNATAEWALQVATAAPTTMVAGAGRLVYQVSRVASGGLSTYTNLALRLPTNRGLVRSESGTCDGCVRFAGTLEGGRIPVAGASVDLRADDVVGQLRPGHLCWFQVQTTTDSRGAFAADVFPGSYRVIVTPNDTRFAVTQSSLEIGSNLMAPQQGQVLEVQRLVPVAGSVVDGARGHVIANARILAVPFAAALGQAASLSRMRSVLLDSLARSSEARTDATGNFTLSLDPGPYRFVIYPPTGSGFAAQISEPTQWVTRAQSTTSTTDPNAPATIELAPFRIGMPIAVSGDVIDADHSPVAGAIVRAFARIREDAMSSPVDIEIAQATANDMGTFSLLLPTRLTP